MLQGRVAAPGLKPNGDGSEDGLSKAMSVTAGSVAALAGNGPAKRSDKNCGSWEASNMGENWRGRRLKADRRPRHRMGDKTWRGVVPVEEVFNGVFCRLDGTGAVPAAEGRVIDRA